MPIPGTKQPRYLEGNPAAASVALSPQEISWIDDKVGIPKGARYAGMGSLNR